jgi:hypothetical protein
MVCRSLAHFQVTSLTFSKVKSFCLANRVGLVFAESASTFSNGLQASYVGSKGDPVGYSGAALKSPLTALLRAVLLTPTDT